MEHERLLMVLPRRVRKQQVVPGPMHQGRRRGRRHASKWGRGRGVGAGRRGGTGGAEVWFRRQNPGFVRACKYACVFGQVGKYASVAKCHVSTAFLRIRMLLGQACIRLPCRLPVLWLSRAQSYSCPLPGLVQLARPLHLCHSTYATASVPQHLWHCICATASVAQHAWQA